MSKVNEKSDKVKIYFSLNEVEFANKNLSEHNGPESLLSISGGFF